LLITQYYDFGTKEFPSEDEE